MNDWRLRMIVDRFEYLSPWAKLTLAVVILTWKMKRHFINAFTFPARLIEDLLKKM